MASTAVQHTPGHSTTFEPLSPATATGKKHDVQTTLNYYKENADGSPPEPQYVNRPETYERPVHALAVTVHDIGGEVDKYTLDKNGFQIFSHQSAEKDFVDDEKIKAEYYPETEQLLKDA